MTVKMNTNIINKKNIIVGILSSLIALLLLSKTKNKCKKKKSKNNFVKIFTFISQLITSIKIKTAAEEIKNENECPVKIEKAVMIEL